MYRLRLSSLGRSLFLAAGSVGLTAGVVFAAGVVILPNAGPDPWRDGTSTLPTVGDLNGSQARLVLSGDDEARYELNQLTVGKWNEGISPGQPLALSLTFRGDGVSVVLSASTITADSPAAGEGASATISVGGASYFGNNGECTISLADVEYTVLEPQPAVLDGVPRGVPIPIYAGTVECEGIEELRTNRRVDVYAVFRHRPAE